MTVLSYALIFLGLTAVSTFVFFCAARGHDESQGKNKEWMVRWESWLFYAGVSALLSWSFYLNPWIGAAIGAVAGIAGTVVGFLTAWYRSPNGIK
jgi:hypothetical protein